MKPNKTDQTLEELLQRENELIKLIQVTTGSQQRGFKHLLNEQDRKIAEKSLIVFNDWAMILWTQDESWGNRI